MRINLTDADLEFIDQARLVGRNICDFEDCAIAPILAAIDAARNPRCPGCYLNDGTHYEHCTHRPAGYSSTPSTSASVVTSHIDCSACHFFRTIPALDHSCGLA